MSLRAISWTLPKQNCKPTYIAQPIPFLCLFWMSFLVRNCFREKPRGLSNWRMRSIVARPPLLRPRGGRAQQTCGPSSYANSIFCSLLARFNSFFPFCSFPSSLSSQSPGECVLLVHTKTHQSAIVVWMHFLYFLISSCVNCFS